MTEGSECSRSSPEDAESEAIAAHARAGRLDLSDPAIRREATQAMRHATRSHMWGDRRSRKATQWAILAGLMVLAVWVAALVTPVLLSGSPP